MQNAGHELVEAVFGNFDMSVGEEACPPNLRS